MSGLKNLDLLIPKPDPTPADSWRWGLVVGVRPLRVHLEGDPSPLTITPESLVACSTGDRVRVHTHHRRAVIMGRAESPNDKRALPLIAGWTSYGTAYAAPTVRRDISGRISLSGLCRPGTMTSGTHFSTVPAEWAPGRRHIYQVRVGAGAGRLNVDADGRIIFFEGTGDLVSLEGISWYPGE